MAQCESGTHKAIWRRIGCLRDKDGIAQFSPRRDRRLYSMHSTRVAAVCYVLRARLSKSVVKAMADRSSDQTKWYGQRLIFDPELVERWAFYNPESGSYTDVRHYAQPGKRSRLAG